MIVKKLLATLVASVMICSLISACGGQPAGGSSAASVSTAAGSSAASGSSASAGGGDLYLGALSLLNMTETEYLALTNGKVIADQYLEKKGVYTGAPVADFPKFTGVKFYDTLDAMIMALEAGDIKSAEMPQCTVDYLCAHNDKLVPVITYDRSKADDFDKKVLGRMSVGYSFMFKDDKTALRDDFDKAIAGMKDDGTLDILVKEFITDGVRSEQKEVAFDKSFGETVKIAVTGSVPPMDYVSADGKFAGFNTAICAELGKRLKKNIELVQVDSMGRAAALSSGQVDAVFWTIGANEKAKGGNQTAQEHEAFVSENKKKRTSEQNDVMDALTAGVDYTKTQNRDRPDGTIFTNPYYNDQLIPVAKK